MRNVIYFFNMQSTFQLATIFILHDLLHEAVLQDLTVTQLVNNSLPSMKSEHLLYDHDRPSLDPIPLADRIQSSFVLPFD